MNLRSRNDLPVRRSTSDSDNIRGSGVLRGSGSAQACVSLRAWHSSRCLHSQRDDHVIRWSSIFDGSDRSQSRNE